MNLKVKGLLIGISLFCPWNSMSPQYYGVVLPGLGGGGGYTARCNGLVNIQNIKKYSVPKEKIDLGQDNCIQHFIDQLYSDSLAFNKKLILLGCSQGTATLVNWLSTLSHEEQENRVACLILESVLGSGRSAIMQTASSIIQINNVPLLTRLPGASHWIPAVAKSFIFPDYNQLGKQVLKTINKLSPQIPVIIIHDQNDFQLSINDARQAYIELKRVNHSKVYLIEVPFNEKEKYRRHLELFGSAFPGDERAKDLKHISVLQAIYKKEGLPFITKTFEDNFDENSGIVDLADEINNVDVLDYQPSIVDVELRINKSPHVNTCSSCCS